MTNQILIIYKFIELYHIFEELSLDLNFTITFVENEKSLNEKVENFNNYLIISNKKNLNIGNQFVLDNTPINIFKLVEKINIEFLRLQFNNQSHMKINNYIIDLNSREMQLKDIKLKLTEKETNTILYLSKVIKPANVIELQENVWGYQSDIETHTVETHIYRLRKKISKVFKDENFILSKDDGYEINKKE